MQNEVLFLVVGLLFVTNLLFIAKYFSKSSIVRIKNKQIEQLMGMGYQAIEKANQFKLNTQI